MKLSHKYHFFENVSIKYVIYEYLIKLQEKYSQIYNASGLMVYDIEWKKMEKKIKNNNFIFQLQLISAFFCDQFIIEIQKIKNKIK